jgi:SAM-dependent methyltransferase/uncharacterized protein YbaR (Trm112 family)
LRRSHFEALKPLCPWCRTEHERESRIALVTAIRETADTVEEGVLHCSDSSCQLEYPIIDGIPILVPDVRAYIAQHIQPISERDDLSATMEGIVGDAAGPGSAFDTTRQHLSTYAWDGYGDRDPKESGGPAPGAVVDCLQRGLEITGSEFDGPAIDLGCAVGRTGFELAERSDALVLGIDVNFAMLRLAQRVLRSGTVRYPRRRVGIVYDRREFDVTFPGADRVDFWACDALALPFADSTFGLAVGLNVLDCVNSPLDLLASIRRSLRPGGTAILATPHDWSANATPVEAWLGGHSQRGPHGGSSESLLKALLTPGAHPQSISGLEFVEEVAEIPWHARLHDRSTVSYRAHLVVARAAPP